MDRPRVATPCYTTLGVKSNEESHLCAKKGAEASPVRVKMLWEYGAQLEKG